MTFDTSIVNSNRTVLVILVIMLASLALHVGFISRLNIVEDESGYMQDAAQISWQVLPFREFGGTKGPIFLVTLKVWQLVFGHSLESSRSFAVIAHVISIPLLYLLARNLTSRLTAYGAALLWGIVPVIVSLTTNVMHIPLELVFILGAAALLSHTIPSTFPSTIIAATLFYAALLTRATSIAFLPLLLLLLFLRTRSWKPIILFALTGAGWLMATVAIIYPLYGWPKTAFFFNADATLISGKQRAVYSAQEPDTGLFETMFRSALPAWREGLMVMLAALILPFIWLAQRLPRFPIFMLALLFFTALSQLVLEDIDSWWPPSDFNLQWMIARSTLGSLIILGLIGIWLAKRVPRISTRLMLILFIWISGFVLFYKGWGRSPTPYYILESLPAFCLAAAVTIYSLDHLLRLITNNRPLILRILLSVVFTISLLAPYQAMDQHQYRGTVTVAAAKEIANHIKNNLPPDEPLFTGQPVFAYLSGHPLYGGYTHPGWYLSERAGYLPPEIRGVFLPDFSSLTDNVQRDVNWIVADWRTHDIYFNESHPATTPLREMLARDFEPIVTVKNPASRDITLYRRQ